MVTAPEASVLLTVAALYDNRKPDQYVAREWADALKDHDFEDAKQAIRDHYRTPGTGYLTVADVIAGIRRIRDERVKASPDPFEVELPEYLQLMEDGPEFNAAYLEWLQRQTAAAAAGEPVDKGVRPPVSVEGRERVRELVASLRANQEAAS